MEIERKFLVNKCPTLEKYSVIQITQAYVSIQPVIRIRKSNEDFFLTIKSSGAISREEYEMPITDEEFHTLLKKVEGTIITKKRYLIPLEDGLTAELDVFEGSLSPLTTVEVEFASLEEANHFAIPTWFGKDISSDARYKNNNLSLKGLPHE